ncbi:MAG: hypothetical protein NVSMB1_03460 [Polyangiales bacterium]
MVWPVMPEVSGKLRAQLGLNEVDASSGAADEVDQLRISWQRRWETEHLAIGSPIFPKIDADRQKAIFDELGVTDSELGAPLSETTVATESAKGMKGARPKVAAASEIAFDEFQRLDLRVGTVISAERVPKSDKLLRVQVDLGEGELRQVVAGIGKTFAPESLAGQQVVVVANLKPAKLMGYESRGMILAVGGEAGEGDLALLTPNRPRAKGARIS